MTSAAQAPFARVVTLQARILRRPSSITTKPMSVLNDGVGMRKKSKARISRPCSRRNDRQVG